MATRNPSDRRQTRRVLKRLDDAYGPWDRHEVDDPVGCLVGTILSQNTSRGNSSAGYRRLRETLPTWQAVADAPTDTIERAIRVSGLAKTKAPRIRSILRHIRQDRGRVELSFLADLPADEAFAYLTAFDGIGPKTALCVLLFAFEKRVFPVDTHIYRIAIRLGWMDRDVPFARSHEVLTPMIAPADRYAMHILLIAHGRQTCKARSPRCVPCCLLDLCPQGNSKVHPPTGQQ